LREEPQNLPKTDNPGQQAGPPTHIFHEEYKYDRADTTGGSGLTLVEKGGEGKHQK